MGVWIGLVRHVLDTSATEKLGAKMHEICLQILAFPWCSFLLTARQIPPQLAAVGSIKTWWKCPKTVL
jgi:hypothetical protein